jgi:uncharacterized protein YigA (DUF484 family)
MTSNQVRGLAADPIDEQAVIQYLHRNADFFEQHPQVLARLRLQHPRNGSTVSLIERQVDVLREKIQTQESKADRVRAVARANNVLAEKIHRFTRRLLRTAGTGPAIAEIEASLREDFDTFHAVLVIPGTRVSTEQDPSWRFLRRVSADDAGYRSFDTLFAACKPRCGQIRDTQREFLFGAEAPNIGSVAMIPLGGQPTLGLLALGSVDRDRFHPGMSTEFLQRMGELITDALLRS